MNGREEKLQAIAVGDSVTVQRTGFSRKTEEIQVTRVTTTQIVCGDERFSREHGRKLGATNDRWDSRDYIVTWDTKKVEA